MKPVRTVVMPILLLIGLPVAVASADGSLGRLLPLGQETPVVAHTGLKAADLGWDGLSPEAARSALSNLSSSGQMTARGASEERLYKAASPGVVIVATKEGFGSGSIISSDGKILTSWHVVSGYATVGVIFKPATEGAEVTDADVVRADVVSVDQVADLALLKVNNRPANTHILSLGDVSDVEIGADVHAIGDPTGETWTYTKGIISQVRLQYAWKDAEGPGHKADVIQTQTPINPGNSGGPLLSDSGKLIGVNAFKVADAEGLNYAVSISEIRRFLAHGAKSEPIAKNSDCQPKVLFQGRTAENDGSLTTYDVLCDGKAQVSIFIPDDTSKPYEAWLDRNEDGKVDMVVFAEGRNTNWKYSIIDSHFTGKPDLMGIHADGSLSPTSYAPYKG